MWWPSGWPPDCSLAHQRTPSLGTLPTTSLQARVPQRSAAGAVQTNQPPSSTAQAASSGGLSPRCLHPHTHSALQVGLNAQAMVTCSLMHASILRSGKEYVDTEAEAEYILRCQRFIADYARGQYRAPPAPTRTFEEHWNTRCERDWKFAFQLYSAGARLPAGAQCAVSVRPGVSACWDCLQMRPALAEQVSGRLSARRTVRALSSSPSRTAAGTSNGDTLAEQFPLWRAASCSVRKQHTSLRRGCSSRTPQRHVCACSPQHKKLCLLLLSLLCRSRLQPGYAQGQALPLTSAAPAWVRHQ